MLCALSLSSPSLFRNTKHLNSCLFPPVFLSGAKTERSHSSGKFLSSRCEFRFTRTPKKKKSIIMYIKFGQRQASCCYSKFSSYKNNIFTHDGCLKKRIKAKNRCSQTKKKKIIFTYVAHQNLLPTLPIIQPDCQ